MNANPPVKSGTVADDPEVRAWDQYWRDGRLASCGGEGGAGYQSAITEGWRAFFGSLPEGRRIVDVCAGNGAVARMAETVALERGIRFSIEAFDSAQLAPPRSSGGGASMIHFSSRVAAESLPYADDAFDVVVGQYGLEYSDMERSVPELARVSAPGARVRLMTHAREGVVVELAGLQVANARRIRGSGIFEAARALAESRAGGAPEADLEALKDRYNAAVRDLERAAAESVEPEIYSNICGVLTYALSNQQRVGAEPVLRKIRDAVENVGAHEARLGAMQAAALDEAGARALGERIAALWRREVRVEAGRRDDGALFGWVIETPE